MEGGSMELSLDTAMAQVFKDALYNNKLFRGLKETVRYLDRKEAQMCFLAKDCSEQEYVTLVTNLCKQNNIPLVIHPSQKKMGELAGLCKIDKDGVARKVVKCSSCCVIDFGEETASSKFLFEYAKTQDA